MTIMSKVNEPMPIYYSRPQITALKKRLKASIERENNVEVLLQYESLMCSQSEQKYDEAYLRYAELAKEMDPSALADPNAMAALQKVALLEGIQFSFLVATIVSVIALVLTLFLKRVDVSRESIEKLEQH